jgi:hypothetical protein
VESETRPIPTLASASEIQRSKIVREKITGLALLKLSEELSETSSERHRSARDRNYLKSVAGRCKHVLKLNIIE